ncbi:hypothetical protein GCM10022223_43280 [Kineosporia mesophila]|uniref:Uncharacterized protein n=1 Tax=Kineosporia mesophila TaxID=566012 RepID=A0ABP7A0C9_9ACTN|nr:hypothetical protein [Kineosporia mesophila]MCD5353238.1 hypothetical protein [Kineosporia mesophila]
MSLILMPETRQATFCVIEAVLGQQTKPYAAALMSMPNVVEAEKSAVWTRALVAAFCKAAYGETPTQKDLGDVGRRAATRHHQLSGLSATTFEILLNEIYFGGQHTIELSASRLLAPYFLLATLLPPASHDDMSRRSQIERAWSALEQTWPTTAHYRSLETEFDQANLSRLPEAATARLHLELSECSCGCEST